MMRPTGPREAPLVVHVLPARLRRGAQKYASDLLAQLGADGSAYRHELFVLFGADEVVGDDRVPDSDRGLLRRSGFDPFALLRLRRGLATRQPAIVVAHGGESLKYAVLGGVDAPVVYLKIGQAAPAARRRLRKRWHRWLVRRADAIVGVSDDVAVEVVEEFGAAPASVQVIPNGRDPETFRPDPGRTTNDPPVVLFVGRMTRTKRPHLYLDVLARLRQIDVLARGRMIGDGDLLDEVRERGRQLGVEVLGGRDDVAAQLAAADLFLFTSTPEGEGMPGVLIEAAMSGLPIVTTRVPGASDVVLHGRTGLVVAPDDLDELVRGCASLLSDPTGSVRMGAQAREWARETFALRAGAARWEDLFHDLCPEIPNTDATS